MNARTRLLVALVAVAGADLIGVPPADAALINTGSLGQNGWHSDDTRSSSDIDGVSPSGTNLVGLTKTDSSYVGAPTGGTSAHDTAIDTHILFGTPPVSPPAGEHQQAVQLKIGNTSGGKTTISHIDTAGHAPGSVFAGAGFQARYSWMGQGAAPYSAALKIGFQTSEFGSAAVSTRSGENVWDKSLIYEPSNGNGHPSNGTWFQENLTATAGKWWLVDRVRGFTTTALTNPLTLDAWATSTIDYNGGAPGTTTFSELFGMMTDAGSEITSVQFGIGSANNLADVFVNELETNWYRSGNVTTFGSFPTSVPVAGGAGVSGTTGGGSAIVGGSDFSFTGSVDTPGTFSVLYSTPEPGDVSLFLPPGAEPLINFGLPGFPTQIWNIDFDGEFTGGITMTLAYDDTILLVPEHQLGIFHYTGGVWEYVTDGLVRDPIGNTITFHVDSLSPFMLGAAAVPEPGTLVLAVLGAVVLVMRQTRRRRKRTI